jgi:hypothetical protein
VTENDNKQKQNGEGENNSQELPEQKEQSSFHSRSNRNNDWFFGVRRKEPTPPPQTIPDQIENILNNVDFDLLMETIDMFVTTVEPLKPLIKEITPFFHINTFRTQKSPSQ